MNQEITSSKTKVTSGLANKEGELTKAVEQQTSKLPSLMFLFLAVSSIGLSATLAMTQKRKGWANFVGQWAPTFLLLGIYNKLVKVEGSDQQTRLLH